MIQSDSKLALQEVDTSERLYLEPKAYFDGLLADIGRAQQEIVLESFIFRLDEVGRQFVSALQKACARGVRVRLLVDGVGSYLYTNRLVDLLESDRCEIRIFHPLPWDFKAYRNALSAGQHYSQLLSSFALINRRNHRKLCIIDRRVAWLGSFNIAADHYNGSPENADNNWHDTGLRTDGEVVEDLLQNFEQVWLRKGKSRAGRARRFLAINSIRGRTKSLVALLHLLRNANQRVWMTNAYFNPSRRLLKTLKALARRGISVQLIVPSLSDVFIFPSISRTFYADLLSAGIRVYEYQNRVLHSKTILIDDAVLVGSTNLNYRSFFHDLEVDALVDEPGVVEQMEQRFLADIESCSEITLKNWQKFPLLLKLLGWFPRLLRYWF